MVEIVTHLCRSPANLGRANGFVGFLCICRFGFVHAGRIRHIAIAITGSDIGPYRRYCLAAELDTIGTHISNKAGSFRANINALIQSLGNLHGPLGGEAKLARCFLLHG